MAQLDGGIATSLGSDDARAERRDTQSLAIVALHSLVKTPDEHECEELTVFECVSCGLCISTAGSGKTCVSAQHRDVNGTVSFEALSGDSGKYARPREARCFHLLDSRARLERLRRRCGSRGGRVGVERGLMEQIVEAVSRRLAERRAQKRGVVEGERER